MSDAEPAKIRLCYDKKTLTSLMQKLQCGLVQTECLEWMKLHVSSK